VVAVVLSHVYKHDTCSVPVEGPGFDLTGGGWRDRKKFNVEVKVIYIGHVLAICPYFYYNFVLK